MNGKKYTVQDTQTGKTVTFEWNHPTDPTDSDFEEVFKAAGYRNAPIDSGKTAAPIPEQKPPSFLSSAYKASGLLQPETISGAQKAIGQFKEGNPLAGLAGLFNTAVNQGSSTLTGINEILHRDPALGGVADILNAPFQGLASAGTGISNSLFDAVQSGGYAPGIGVIPPNLGMNEKKFEEAKQGVGQAAGTAAQFAVPALIGKAIPKVGRGLETEANRMAGKAFGAGENFKRTEELGKFAQEHGITLTKSGYDQAKTMAQHLNDEINTKIIKPATEAGVTIDPKDYISKLYEYKSELENRAVPDRGSIKAIDKMIESATQRALKSPNGRISPEEAQQMKVENNQILSDVYKKLEAGGNVTEKVVAKKAGLVQLNDELRSQLEQIHPELRNVNWHEGAALSLRNAIYDYLNRTARGEGSAAMVARGGLGKTATLSVYDLLHVNPIKSRLAVLLGKVGRSMSGNQPNTIEGVKTPYPQKPESFGTSMSQMTPEQMQQNLNYNRTVADLKSQASPFYAKVKPIADKAGARIEEINKGAGGEMRVRFTDMKTMHTDSLPVDQFTLENIKKVIASKKQK